MTRTRLNRLNRRVDSLIETFPVLIGSYNRRSPFRREDQLFQHRKCLEKRRQFSRPSEAVADDAFVTELHRTLGAWGIGLRGSRLKDLVAFRESVRQVGSELDSLADCHLEGLTDVSSVSSQLFDIIRSLGIVDNKATLVPCTKLLQHVLPDLVVPIDRQYTQRFFGWHNPEFQSQQRKCWAQAFETFVSIARAVNPRQYVEPTGWNSGVAKIIDNGIVAWLIENDDARAR